MLKHSDITLGRFTRFQRDLKDLLYPLLAPVSALTVYSAPSRISYDEAMKGTFRPVKDGEQFGPGWSTHWFRIDYAIPKSWRDREVLLEFNASSEGCVWQNGVPLQGLTSYNWAPEDVRSHFTITPRARGRESGTLYVEAAINGLFGLSDNAGRSHVDQRLGNLRHVRLTVRDRAVWDLLWDFTVIKEMAEAMPSGGVHQGPALYAANEIVNAVRVSDPATYKAGRAVARKFLAARNGDRNHYISAVGHAHIDTAWLWPLAETQRKCYRTFATAVRMMDDYPEYKFVCSQAQQLAWIKAQQPALFEKIKAKVRKGQFLPVGGTWIEPDCNLPSGESLVRQFLLGQRFFKREFGAYCKEFWNPDVFGYSGALPQIMRGAGIRYFLTQKLSWNQFNRPTSSTFLWEGIDGTPVLTHFPPSDTYNAMNTVEEVLKHYSNFKDRERASESMLLFGFGDGGGGPTEEMLERVQRMENLAGLPEISMRTPAEFFERCEKDLTDPARWRGELYFELHRGTYTTQAANKRDNRRSEEALHDAEFLSALAALDGASYPTAEINGLWETVLLNQFHDIIPGSSITEVYEDSARDYARVLGSAAELREAACERLLPAKDLKGSRVLALNTLSWPRREVVKLDDDRLALAEAPAYGFAVAEAQSSTPHQVKVQMQGRGFVLTNGLVRARFDAEGRLTSFFDKRHDRECIEPGAKGNQFVLYEDKPRLWDAWDVDVYHLEKRRNVGRVQKTRVIESGPLRGRVELQIEITEKCVMVLWISLDAESPRLDFEAHVDWHETDEFLKVEFPLALRSDFATYEIQFGHVRRPTHFNTTWDIARFEVSAHRWADLSEPQFGVALLNDSKYGYACHDNVLRLSLLRAPKAPDPKADMGRHSFRYALYPHEGGPQLGGVIPEAAAFNQPLQAYSTNAEPQSHNLVQVDNPAIVIDTVKLAEDSGAVILRLYESHGAHQKGTLTVGRKVRSAARVDLLEREEETLQVSSNRIALAMRPFELLTLKLGLVKQASRA